jgi:exodeoxyribonuclease-3
MKIVSYNVNGIRAAMKKGLIDFIKSENPDILGFQELKANKEDIDEKAFQDLGYHTYWLSAEKKGYSGVGIITREKPLEIIEGMGHEFFDKEGRTLIAVYKDFTLVNTYFPSGTSGDERQRLKYEFLDFYFKFIAELKNRYPNLIVLGDYNIAHTDIDIHSPKTNQKSSGFLPEERAWMTKLLSEGGMVDVYRQLHPDTTDACYTWWSNRGQAYANNVGWRLDYHLTTPALAETARSVSIYKDEKFSDHAPITVSYDMSI